MIEKRYFAICDRCGEHSNLFARDKESKSRLLDMVIGAELWISMGNKCYCPDCYRHNDETDNYDILPEDL